MNDVRILGLGNVLMGDDGFGPWVIHTLERRYDFPEGVRVLDVGTPGLDLTPYLTDARAVILIDTVLDSGPPGRIRLFGRDDLRSFASAPRLSPHDPGLADALVTLELAGRAPKSLLLVGVTSVSTPTGIGLSPEISTAVESAVEIVRSALGSLGLAPRPRPDVVPTRPWWSVPPEAVPLEVESVPRPVVMPCTR